MNNAAHNRQPQIDIPDSVAKLIVSQMHAVGDEMRMETRRNQYATHNHDKSKFWDVLNTRLCEAFSSPDCMSSIKRRGFWELLLSFYRPSGLVLTFMREQRFKALQAEIKKRGRMTYVDLLVRHINGDLVAPQGQMSMIPMEFSDDDKLAQRVQALLNDFHEETSFISRYVIILFESDSTYELRRVRAVIVDSNLDIVEECSWTHFIPVMETSVVEQVSNSSAPSNNPSRGLSLTSKALGRKSHQKAPSEKSINEDESPTE